MNRQILLRRSLYSVERFFCGRLYPSLLALLVFAGHALSIEVYTNAVICISVSLGFLFSRSLRHFIFPLCAYIYQISPEHSPGLPAYSDYYFSGFRGVVSVALFLLLAVCLAIRVWRSHLIRRAVREGVPLLLPSALLSVAFLLNGVLSGEWLPSSLAFGAVSIVTFFGLTYLFFLGLSRERGEELISYFIYVTSLLALVLIAQTITLYLGGNVVGADGIADKEAIVYGWGIWATAGMGISVLIPVLLLGAMRGEATAFYLSLSFAALGAVALNLSRAALLVGITVFSISFLVGCFCGKRRRLFRAVGASVFAAAVLFGVLLHNEIYTLLRDYFERGFSDNGRLALWEYGIDAFLEAPLFGKGFYALETDVFEAIEFLPDMLHNTPIQIAASMGVAGLICYAYYRIEMLKSFIFRPTLERSALGLSMLALLLGSLFDNFLFYIQPMFYYSVALAISYRLDGA